MKIQVILLFALLFIQSFSCDDFEKRLVRSKHHCLNKFRKCIRNFRVVKSLKLRLKHQARKCKIIKRRLDETQENIHKTINLVNLLRNQIGFSKRENYILKKRIHNKIRIIKRNTETIEKLKRLLAYERFLLKKLTKKLFILRTRLAFAIKKNKVLVRTLLKLKHENAHLRKENREKSIIIKKLLYKQRQLLRKIRVLQIINNELVHKLAACRHLLKSIYLKIKKFNHEKHDNDNHKYEHDQRNHSYKENDLE